MEKEIYENTSDSAELYVKDVSVVRRTSEIGKVVCDISNVLHFRSFAALSDV